MGQIFNLWQTQWHPFLSFHCRQRTPIQRQNIDGFLRNRWTKSAGIRNSEPLTSIRTSAVSGWAGHSGRESLSNENAFLGDIEMEEWIDKLKFHVNEADRGHPQDGMRFEKYHSVEMKPARSLPIYQFKLYGEADKDRACIFVKPNSDIIDHLDTGEVIAMKYLPKEDNHKFVLMDTRIRRISIEDRGAFSGFHKVEISVADTQ